MGAAGCAASKCRNVWKKVSLLSAFLRKPTASVWHRIFRHQGQCHTAGHGLVRHCPPLHITKAAVQHSALLLAAWDSTNAVCSSSIEAALPLWWLVYHYSTPGAGVSVPEFSWLRACVTLCPGCS